MGSSLNFAKTILIPASIALTVYLLLSFLIIPFLRRYHQRYSQYLPLHTISAHTVSLRDRIADGVMRFVLRTSWRRDAHAHAADNDNVSIDEEEGEVMVGMDMDARRREALERDRDRRRGESEGRLSRELEEGFMDESDEEGDGGTGGRGVLGIRGLR